ncbi:MAG: response regulator transcription factor [Acidobacteriota bacterium]|nr:response regulator transcription factor [Acidobacteriota bacterium]
MKILIVEDERHIAEGLRFNLEAENFEVEIASDGRRALDILLPRHKEFDAIVLDVMLPELSGFTVARRLREAEIFTPVLMLTARGSPEDVLQGFEAGTDDYLPKPFELEIFMARLSGLLRRREWLQREKASEKLAASIDKIYVVNGRTIDFESLELWRDGVVNNLTLMEVKLLRYLIENAGVAVSRKMILEEVWDLHEDTDTRAIDNFIVRLRRHLEDAPENPRILLTVRSVGYKFVKE